MKLTYTTIQRAARVVVGETDSTQQTNYGDKDPNFHVRRITTGITVIREDTSCPVTPPKQTETAVFDLKGPHELRRPQLSRAVPKHEIKGGVTRE